MFTTRRLFSYHAATAAVSSTSSAGFDISTACKFTRQLSSPCSRVGSALFGHATGGGPGGAQIFSSKYSRRAARIHMEPHTQLGVR